VIVISSGHGKHVDGAQGFLDEHPEAVRVVNRVSEMLTAARVDVTPFEDTTSTTQSENLDTIVDFHNSRGPHELDVSVHFNSGGGSGSEVLYVTQQDLAGKVSAAMSQAAGWTDRGAKHRSDLAFLNRTNEPAILLEVCFVDSAADAEAYRTRFDVICAAIARTIGNIAMRPRVAPLLQVSGRCSWFGGPDDMGVAPDEGLAFIYDYHARPDLFLAQQPAGTTGLARRLNPDVYYVACRWDYAKTPKEMLAGKGAQALVRTSRRAQLAWPADWGPHGQTQRVADLSPGLMDALEIVTDDPVEVIYPAPAVR
jgi:N-acetylmuramoyl-L-alanine amidase